MFNTDLLPLTRPHDQKNNKNKNTNNYNSFEPRVKVKNYTSKINMKPPSASCGLTFNCAEDLTAKLRVMTLAGYDFLVTPIIHPRYRLPEEMDQPSSMVTASGKAKT